MGEVGKMAEPCSMGLVLVEFGYEYTGEDGNKVSIKPNERYTLLAKTNDHWWHVRKDEHNTAFYIPAKYVKELPSSFPSPLDFVDSSVPELKPPTVPDPAEKLTPNEVTIRMRSPGNRRKTENRMSTFGVPLDIHEPTSYMYAGSKDAIVSLHSMTSDSAKQKKRNSITPNLILSNNEALQKSRVRNISPADVLSRQGKPVEPPTVKYPIETLLQGPQAKPEPLPEHKTESSPEQTASMDSENIYESILDLHLDQLVKTEPGLVNSPTASAPPVKPEPEPTSTAVYANVIDLKKHTSRLAFSSASSCSSPGLPLSPAPDSPDWEAKTEQDSDPPHSLSPLSAVGMDTCALSVPATPAPSVPAPSSVPPAISPNSDWKQHLDEETGRLYYYNPSLKQTSWSVPEALGHSTATEAALNHGKQAEGPPPLPEEDYPTDEQEVHVLPPQSPRDTNVPQLKLLPRVTLDPGSPALLGYSCFTDSVGKPVFTSDHTHQQVPAAGGPPVLGNGVEANTVSKQETLPKFFPTHRRIASDFSSDTSSIGNSSDIPPALLLEKAGILNKTKITDNGKKLRKNWAQSWSVLHGGILTFYKDPKSTPSAHVTKTNQIVPEYTVELKGASVCKASKEKSSKKNVLELKTRHGSEYLIQYDTDSIIHDWHKIIQDTIKYLEQEHCSEEEEDEVIEKPTQSVEKDKKATRQSSTSSVDTEQGRVRTKLRKFLQRRPTLQAVKEKGYIKDNVFGCHLDTLCHRENTTIPKFVEKCIRSVERRGLNIDGIYRVSGNLAVIQKLRHRADHEEDLDLDDGQWEEIHVITGALKLFFRELPEPLFPFNLFEKFIAAIKINDEHLKVSYMRDLVRGLPLPNHNTMEALFRHLRKVDEHNDLNRMSNQSIAIVFGPTLLRPEKETNDMAYYMIFQNQIVELILRKFNEVFGAR